MWSYIWKIMMMMMMINYVVIHLNNNNDNNNVDDDDNYDDRNNNSIKWNIINIIIQFKHDNQRTHIKKKLIYTNDDGNEYTVKFIHRLI